MITLATSTADQAPTARLSKGRGNYIVEFGDLGFLMTSNYDEASEYYKACVAKQLETI